VNPDGLSRHTRQNARGVDLNRNFPFLWQRTVPGSHYYGGPKPLSERESRVVARWVKRLKPAVSIWYHQPWNAVLVPCHGGAPVARRYARRAHSATSCRGHELRGTAIQWEKHLFPKTSPFVVELPAAGVTTATATRHASAALLAAAGR
jgi:protein MpaA